MSKNEGGSENSRQLYYYSYITEYQNHLFYISFMPNNIVTYINWYFALLLNKNYYYYYVYNQLAYD